MDNKAGLLSGKYTLKSLFHDPYNLASVVAHTNTTNVACDMFECFISHFIFYFHLSPFASLISILVRQLGVRLNSYSSWFLLRLVLLLYKDLVKIQSLEDFRRKFAI